VEVVGMVKVKTQYYFYAVYLALAVLDFFTFSRMDPTRETNPIWIVLGGKYLLFTLIYIGFFTLIITFTELLLKVSGEKRPAATFMAYSMLVFGCQAHLFGAISNLDPATFATLFGVLGIHGTILVDYVIFTVLFLMPIPLSFVAFKGWSKHQGIEA
jgi:hypothetical protein